MKASESLLLNSMVCGHARSKYIDREGNRCALATIMLELTDDKTIVKSIKQRYHIFAPYQCWLFGETQVSEIMVDIIELNDTERLTRPDIATWLQRKELAYGEIGPKQPIVLNNQGEQHGKVLTCEAVDDMYQLAGTHRMHND